MKRTLHAAHAGAKLCGMADPESLAADCAVPPPVASALHVADGEVLSRVGPMFVQLTNGLCSGGTHVALLTDSAEMVARLQGTPVECHRVAHLRGWRAWGLFERLAGRFTPPPDIIHVWDGAGLRGVQHWSVNSGVPVVAHVLSTHGLQGLLRGGLEGTECVVAGSKMLATSLSS